MHALSHVCIAVVFSGAQGPLAASRRLDSPNPASLLRKLLRFGRLSFAQTPHQIPTAFDVGGGERDRTDDLRLAKPALSQLSYAP